ncbi:hypothetical protein ASE67_02540 [Sphingomonas sp. Leaf23]|uniref:hypothetical protein n=1 Tax=Sphingomonas sp. Leaf23 TaxID=1735689 RepID=UPI0006F4FBEF|nr:hypothetical protein [Sphingomonas sp. Leaf23]KQM88638.1 hypothetical protein ASE67_02540 [Sphingomonas sp. Leaf23]
MTGCLDCGTALGRRNVSGRCRTCTIKRVNACPATAEKRKAGIHAKLARDPDYRAALVRRAVTLHEKLTPEQQEARRLHGIRQRVTVLSRPDVQARTHSPEARAKRGRSASATWLSWCPADRREEYRRLIRSKRIPAAEARAIIEAEVAGTPAAARREVATHQLQMRLRHERDLASRY